MVQRPRERPRPPKVQPTTPEVTGPAGPVRTCVGCRRRAPAADLVRIARRPDGTLAVSRTLPGRGAWLCAGSLDCLHKAAQRNAFSRALRSPVSSDVVLALAAEIVG
jgi:predicted RNA-binding protein YlxR (DUF448 family)